jgi:hypothetical protein
MSRLLLLVFTFLPLCAGAEEEPLSIEAIAAGYFRAASYCDTGKFGRRAEPAVTVLCFQRRFVGPYDVVQKD